jgi:hypothetical protein
LKERVFELQEALYEFREKELVPTGS